MATKRVMPDMFAAAPVRPPRVDRAASKFNHYVPAAEPEASSEAPQIDDEPALKSVASIMREATHAEPVAPTPSPRPHRMQRVSARPVVAIKDEAWAAFDLPQVEVSIPVFNSVESLLSGELTQTPLHVLPAMAETFQRIKANVRGSGRKVSLQTLYAHGLAFAYLRADEWLSLAPSDGRREGSRSRLTSTGTRITPELPRALIDATHALVAKATVLSPKNAPALESVKTAALAWALGRYMEWLDYAIEHPVKAGEKRA